MIKFDKVPNPLWLFSIDEFNQLPNGIEVESVTGAKRIKGYDFIDLGTVAGYTAHGVRLPETHELSELFTLFKLRGDNASPF